MSTVYHVPHWRGVKFRRCRVTAVTPLTVRPNHGRDLIVYIDGFNLYHGLHEASGRSRLWLDLVALAKSLRPRSHLVQVKYFTAPVLDEPDALSRQETYQKALLAQSPGLVTVVPGRYQSKLIGCRKCGHAYTHYEEKETDVNIAVALVADTLTHACSDALIISADSDLVPAVRTVQAKSPGTFVVAAFPPKRYSAHLHTLMPRSFIIGASKINQSQLPEQVVDPETGIVYSRPAKWT
jgi:uncharacterized LabA/DUF88 family protein